VGKKLGSPFHFLNGNDNFSGHFCQRMRKNVRGMRRDPPGQRDTGPPDTPHVQDLPVGLPEARLRRGLREFGIEAAETAYAPVGYGDYHWTVTDADGRRWFATVADLAGASAGSASSAGPASPAAPVSSAAPARSAALGRRRRAMDTAVELHDAGLRFVVAPCRAIGGATVVALDERYALSVFPFVAGVPGAFGQQLPPHQQTQRLDLLAALHDAPPPATTPPTSLDIEGRSGLVQALHATDRWTGGPFAPSTQKLLADNADLLRTRLDDFDQLAAEVRGRGAPHVVTHGEPHPGNLIMSEDGLRLIDWDTVGLAVPERDLSVVSANPADLVGYTQATGRALDPAALALYRLRWHLVDVAEFVAWLRVPHTRSPDTESAWQNLVETINHLARTDFH
jgi:spectinomycin phosphotransferase